MPIIIGTGGGGGPGTEIPGGGTPSATPRVRYGTGRRSTIETCWFEPDEGYEVNLSTLLDEGQFKQGLDGRFLAPIEHVIDQSPGSPGGWYRGTRRGLASLRLPLLLTADTPDELRQRTGELAGMLDVGPGWLHVETTWGVHRRIRAIYESGIDEDPASDGNETDFLLQLQWRALSSYWEAAEPIVGGPAENEQAKREFFPGPPWILGETTVITAWSEFNDGETKAWPVIVVRGPATNLIIRNERVSGSLAFPQLQLVAGDELTIDSRRQRKTMQTSSGVNGWPYTEDDMFPLLVGENRMSFQALDTTDETAILVYHYPQFKGV